MAAWGKEQKGERRCTRKGKGEIRVVVVQSKGVGWYVVPQVNVSVVRDGRGGVGASTNSISIEGVWRRKEGQGESSE